MQLTPSLNAIVLSEVCPSGKEGITDRTLFTIEVKYIIDLCLGQGTPLFVKALDYAPVIPQGTQMPPTSERCALASLRVSILVEAPTSNLKSKKETSIYDFVFNTNSDYEAWIVTLHRLTSLEPHWPGPMDLSGETGYEKLSEKEVKFCEKQHITPSALLRRNTELLHNTRKVRRLYLTLFDFRNILHLELIHAQQVFLFYLAEGCMEQHTLNQIQKNAQVRAIRIRLINVLRYYKNTNFAQIQRFLFSTQGKEEFLEKLTSSLGPEPTEEQLQISIKKGSGKNTEEVVDEVAEEVEGNQPTKEELEILEEEKRPKTELQHIVQLQQQLEDTVNRQLEQQPITEEKTQKTGDDFPHPPVQDNHDDPNAGQCHR
ncbi:hypothetical protein LSM04_001503 [Trypanosoma melophagium]|uniref:uncharacterized protein n=1 Tax=Trypanosoma melophagium TaxID=715481 RepID=UPI003519DC51|nr:hypothetical protein LSM04_001503 [Trypanosoma melophagium]